MTSMVVMTTSIYSAAIKGFHELHLGMPSTRNLRGVGVAMQNHQIDQLKEEISGKDLALVKEHFDHMKVGPLCSFTR